VYFQHAGSHHDLLTAKVDDSVLVLKCINAETVMKICAYFSRHRQTRKQPEKNASGHIWWRDKTGCRNRLGISLENLARL